MTYAVCFLIYGVYCLVVAVRVGGVAWVLVWPGVSFLAVAAAYAYAGAGPRLLGKLADGRIHPAIQILFLPYFLFALLVWHLQRLISREDCCNQICPGLWIGRRPLGNELPAGVEVVVDLTAEFSRACNVPEGAAYHCLPILDASVASEARFREWVDWIATTPQTVYIHCAQGHGRSAALAAAVLIRKGIAADVNEAEQRIKACRPGIRLKPAQRKLVQRGAKPEHAAPAVD